MLKQAIKHAEFVHVALNRLYAGEEVRRLRRILVNKYGAAAVKLHDAEDAARAKGKADESH